MIRVLIVDDDPLVRAGLTLMIDGAGGITVVGEAPDGETAITATNAHNPDVVLMDVRMPGIGGLAATKALRTRKTPPEIVVLTTFDADEIIVDALQAGASGFLLKDTPPPEIVEAIRKVAAGDPILSPTVTRKLMTKVTTGATRYEKARTAFATLSDREHEVALAVANGKTNAEIAADLLMSVATVKAHVSHTLTKLGLTNRTQIALLAHEADLV
ncbi:DNA-binding response regulator, NarL/FixJ family, contains REC and HTH domains [Saccharopolyspora antimicrobica]|uniref:DNA-binding response regulator, NarL/FixJ family, contains REC and HTH domains n=1 Tax=Saccharopolyspora antimicrobica TaxID=455193 RepID=A0A1I5F0K6_9PSEU|nr:LuxR family two component transcriptional regulator [Saccharopolyspora antimicrobica]SFO17193.1 DNA-binding response regulator, NarL/FixJ family, contains REC and HTH domains [Saccharopolyspora antimicrobica]